MMNASTRGISFILVTVFLVLISLSGIHLANMSAINYHSSNIYGEQIKVFVLAESSLIEIESILQKNNEVNCLKPVVDDRKLSMLPSSWWELYACQLNNANLKTYYFTERLQTLPCTISSTDMTRSVQFNRISIRSETVSGVYAVLRSVIAISSMRPRKEKNCKNFKIVDLGRQSWVELY